MPDIPEKHLADANVTVSLALKSWNRFKTPNLRVDPGLLGADHSFTHQGKSLKISLPATSEAADAKRVEVDYWRGRGGDTEKEPAGYLIHSVDVSVSLQGLHTLPSAVLDQPANASDTLAPDQQIQLEQLATTFGQIALEAFDLWMRCVRWKTGFGQFGRAGPVVPETGWGNRLRDASSGKMVWIGKQRFVSPARSAISPVHWANIRHALVGGDSPPVFVDLLFDAEMHIEAGDFRRAVIDTVVAAEAYIRTTVRSVLPGEMTKFMPIKQVLRKLFPKALATLGKAGFKEPDELQDILEVRNAIMHSGNVGVLGREKCLLYVATVRKLITDHVQYTSNINY